MSTGGGSVGGGGGGGFRPLGGGGGGGGNTTIIYVGDANMFGDRTRAGKLIDEALNAARRGGRVRDDSSLSVRFR